MSMRIKKDDWVVVTKGKDRGRRGRVLRVLRDENRVVVEGLNMIVRHKKKNPQNPAKGGRVEMEGAIHLSNVMPWSEADGKGVRVKIGVDKDGKKVRLAAKSGNLIAAADAATTGKREKAGDSAGDKAKK